MRMSILRAPFRPGLYKENRSTTKIFDIGISRPKNPTSRDNSATKEDTDFYLLAFISLFDYLINFLLLIEF